MTTVRLRKTEKRIGICKICQRSFEYIYSFDPKNKHYHRLREYCSRKCFYNDCKNRRSELVEYLCDNCKKYIKKRFPKNYIRKNKFCSNKCRTEFFKKNGLCFGGNKDFESKLEINIKNLLKDRGIVFKKSDNMIGNPDIVFPDKRIVVFIDGCLFHGCEECSKKIREKDKLINYKLIEKGWKVLRFPEHDIRKDLKITVDKIEKDIKS